MHDCILEILCLWMESPWNKKIIDIRYKVYTKISLAPNYWLLPYSVKHGNFSSAWNLSIFKVGAQSGMIMYVPDFDITEEADILYETKV